MNDTLDGGSDVRIPVSPSNATANVACLTASGDTGMTPLPGCPSAIDADGSGALRLTPADFSKVGGVFAATSIPTASGLDIAFDSFQYGGTFDGYSGPADGITFVLAAVDPTNPQPPANVGQVGGSLGYSAAAGNPGLSYGYLGLGLDVYGNYSNTGFQGSGCGPMPFLVSGPALMPGQVVVRGPGNAALGYCALSSTAADTTAPPLALGGGLGYARATSQVPVRIVINSTDEVKTITDVGVVSAGSYAIAFTPLGGSQQLLQGPLPSVAPELGFPAEWLDANGVPKQLAFGWVASTGGATDVHEIRTSDVSSIEPVPVLGVTQRYVGSREQDGSGTFTVTPSVGSTAAAARPVTVTSTLPAGVTPVSGAGTDWSCLAPVGQEITCTNTGGPYAADSTLPSLAITSTNGGGDVTDTHLQTARVVASADDAAPAYADSTTVAALPVADLVMTTGVGTEVQSDTVSVPSGGSVTLLDGDGVPATSVAVPDQGTYELDPDTGIVTFTPFLGFSGTATSVTYRVTDADGQSATSTATAKVIAPAIPAPAPLTSTGVGVAPQTVTIPLPDGGSIALLDGDGQSTTLLTVPDVGSYAAHATDGTLTFVAAAGFSGSPAAVTYRVTDAYLQYGDATYIPTVTKPAPPTAPPATSTGSNGAPQQQAVPVPAGGSIHIMGGSGEPVTKRTIPGEGTYVLDAVTGVITFTPVKGFSGKAAGITFRVVDAYGQATTATYRPVVAAKLAPPAPKPRVKAPALTVSNPSGSRLPTTCSLSSGRISRCDVVLRAKVNGRDTVIGKGRVTVGGKGAYRNLAVPVKLTPLGKALVARPGGVRVNVAVAIRQPASSSWLRTSARTRVVAKTVLVPRPVFFGTDSTALRATDRRYLNGLRGKLAGARSVTCNGYTDSRSTSNYNQKLGRDRAIATCTQLLRGTKIRAILQSFGKSRPQASNRTYDGRALNRRTEIRITY